uniref:Uncharacterized protein n=1 Tax=Timema poppense TaxID=170557 RepID=A0A7R9GTY1_TIMPO|nr:unnamed protein product [Timema poppensis]
MVTPKDCINYSKLELKVLDNLLEGFLSTVQERLVVKLCVSRSLLMSSDRIKPRSEYWAVSQKLNESQNKGKSTSASQP